MADVTNDYLNFLFLAVTFEHITMAFYLPFPNGHFTDRL